MTPRGPLFGASRGVGLVMAVLIVVMVAPVSIVRAHSTDHLHLTVDTTTTAGVTTSTLTVEARDNTDAPDPSYDGTVTFTSSDPSAALPSPDYTFTSGDAGARTFDVTFRSAGSRTVSATDTADAAISGTSNASLVSPGPAATLTASGYPSPTIAGDAHQVTVTAFDAYGNVATGYTGTVGLTSSDPSFAPPGDHTFTLGEAGVHQFSATLTRSGSRSITATDQSDGALAATQSGIVVHPADATTLVVEGFTSPATAGAAHSFTVTAKDPYTNTATGYLGTVTFTSSDGAADLPADYTFLAGNNGTKSFSATLHTPGSRSITATDTVDGSITGSQSGIMVGAGTLDRFVVAGYPDPTTAGVSHPFTVTAKDASGNTITDYSGTVTITTDDSAVTPPGPYTFTVGEGGIHTFAMALETVGNRSITAADGAATGSQTSITVTAGSAAALTITNPYPSTTVAGVSHSFTIRVTDGSGNTASGYRGTVHVASTDPAGTAPFNYTFSAGDAGVHTFSVTLRTAGSRDLSVSDIGDSSLTDGQTGITVTPAGATSLTVTGYPDPNGLGASGSATVTAKDPFGNVATGYTGTVHLSVSFGSDATLPSDHTYGGGEAGAHVFNGISFAQPGTWTLTARDTVTASIAGSTRPASRSRTWPRSASSSRSRPRRTRRSMRPSVPRVPTRTTARARSCTRSRSPQHMAS